MIETLFAQKVVLHYFQKKNQYGNNNLTAVMYLNASGEVYGCSQLNRYILYVIFVVL